VVPKGWKLVPIEPTDEMLKAGWLVTTVWLKISGTQMTVNKEKMRLRYKAMVDAVEEPNQFDGYIV
jgi:hypothetical protein